MSLKKVLGLDTFPIADAEIMRQLEEAFIGNKDEVVFSSGKRRVCVRLRHISPEGLMRDYQDYYAK